MCSGCAIGCLEVGRVSYRFAWHVVIGPWRGGAVGVAKVYVSLELAYGVASLQGLIGGSSVGQCLEVVSREGAAVLSHLVRSPFSFYQKEG